MTTATNTPRVSVDIHLSTAFTGAVHLYDERSPIANFAPGGHEAGMQIQVSSFYDESPEQAEEIAEAAEKFAVWARKYADGCRVHADRVALPVHLASEPSVVQA